MMRTLYLLISFLIVGVDQSLKFFIADNYHVGEVHQVIPGLISFTYLKNNGAAWNILEGQMWLFYLISIIAIGVCLFFLLVSKQANYPLFEIGLALVLGGIVGNFIDRLHLQYVIDMIQLDFIQFNIFNIADAAITIGVGLIFIYLLFFDQVQNKSDE